jgi:hypothetical protein
MENTSPQLDIAAMNAALADAEKSITQARGDLASGDPATALDRLMRSFAVLKRTMKQIEGRNG